jgi:hypothetical protein
MQTLIKDNEPVLNQATENKPLENGVSINDILKDFGGSPMQVDQQQGQPSIATQKPVLEPIRYYQSGSKKGQPRPARQSPAMTGAIKTGVHVNAPVQTVMQGSSILTGAMFITLIDLVFPMLIELGNNLLTKQKISANDLKLTKVQKDELQPLADLVVKQINFTGNPIWLLALSLIGTYAMNFMVLKATGEKPRK